MKLRPIIVFPVLAVVGVALYVFSNAAPKPGTGDELPYFSDDFARSEIGPEWNQTGGMVRVTGTGVIIKEMLNRPLWLRKPMPQNFVLTFDASSTDPDGDIKFELLGDGVSAYGGDLRLAYHPTGFSFVFGGWHNTLSTIAWRNEHADERILKQGPAVVSGQIYKMRVEKRGSDIKWFVNGQLFLQTVVPGDAPAAGYFAFSGWKSEVQFAHLAISSLR